MVVFLHFETHNGGHHQRKPRMKRSRMTNSYILLLSWLMPHSCSILSKQFKVGLDSIGLLWNVWVSTGQKQCTPK